MHFKIIQVLFYPKFSQSQDKPAESQSVFRKFYVVFHIKAYTNSTSNISHSLSLSPIPFSKE